MDNLYGNYLGIVVNNQDPEERKRVQVFVPHLNASLFEEWNQQAEGGNNEKTDKHIRSHLDLGGKILEKLKQILPWAEQVAPLFGGNTSMTGNSTTRRLGVNNSGYTLSQDVGADGSFSDATSIGAAGAVSDASSILIFSGSNDTNVEAYRKNLIATIDSALSLGKPVTVVQPALGGDGGAAIANAAQQVVSGFTGVKFIPNTSYTTSDGVHPDANGYKQIGLNPGSIAFGDSVAVGYNNANGRQNNDITSTVNGLEVGRRGIGSGAILDLIRKNSSGVSDDILPPIGGEDRDGDGFPDDTTPPEEMEEWGNDMTTPQTASADGSTISLEGSRSVSAPYTAYSLGKNVGGTDETQDSWTNKGFSSTGQNLTPGIVAVNPGVYPIGTIFRDPNTGYTYIAADKHGNSNPNVIDFYLTPSQYGNFSNNGSVNLQVIGSIPESSIPKTASGIRDLLSQYGSVPPGESAEEWFGGNNQGLTDSGITPSAGGESPESPESTFIDPQQDARNQVAAATAGTGTVAGSPNGAVTVPNEGSKVWVFFLGGDIQKPIYFGGVVEPST